MTNTTLYKNSILWLDWCCNSLQIAVEHDMGVTLEFKSSLGWIFYVKIEDNEKPLYLFHCPWCGRKLLLDNKEEEKDTLEKKIQKANEDNEVDGYNITLDKNGVEFKELRLQPYGSYEFSLALKYPIFTEEFKYPDEINDWKVTWRDLRETLVRVKKIIDNESE